ncbi:hypothetical protein DFP72DRAFT_452408, partial [Ephemerocybe angulata]
MYHMHDAIHGWLNPARLNITVGIISKLPFSHVRPCAMDQPFPLDIDSGDGRSNSLFRLQDLPEDLARHIFEIATDSGTPSEWARARVSKKVQRWGEPILYRSVLKLKPRLGYRYRYPNESLLKLHRTILSHPSKDIIFSTHVKSLGLVCNGHLPQREIDTLFSGIAELIAFTDFHTNRGKRED